MVYGNGKYYIPDWISVLLYRGYNPATFFFFLGFGIERKELISVRFIFLSDLTRAIVLGLSDFSAEIFSTLQLTPGQECTDNKNSQNSQQFLN